MWRARAGTARERARVLVQRSAGFGHDRPRAIAITEVDVDVAREGRIGDSRSYFAPDFEPPEWRAPYRDGEPVRPPEP